MIELYNMKDLGVKTLIGRKVKSASINKDNDLVVLETDKGDLYLTWEGDCCAHCFLANVSGAENLIDAEILEAENSEWVNISSDKSYDVLETMGTKLKTSKGYVDFESRVEHNGYYGGYIMVSELAPMNQYHSPRYGEDDKLPKMKNLKDF